MDPTLSRQPFFMEADFDTVSAATAAVVHMEEVGGHISRLESNGQCSS